VSAWSVGRADGSSLRTGRAGEGDHALLPDGPARVCVVLLTGIGDVVHGLPLVNAMTDQRPDLRITWVAEPVPAQLLEHHPAVDRLVAFHKADGLRGVARLFRELRSVGRHDVTLNIQRYFKSIPPTLFSRAPVRLGLPRDKTRDGVSLINTHHLPGGPWKHTQDLFLDFLAPLGLERPDELEWRLTLSNREEEEARRFFVHARSSDASDGKGPPPGAPRVGLVMGTANPKKDWPPSRYAPLADALAHDFGFQVFLLGGPGRRERDAAARTVEGARIPPVHALADSVRTLMGRIRGMDLVISPDTGPVHIARAFGVPVVGLYGHSNPWRVGPYDAWEDLIVDAYSKPDESPDPARYEPRLERMERIGVGDVLDTVRLARERYGVGA